MTTITVKANSIEFSGHAKKACVCNAISALSQMVSNYVIRNEWGKVDSSDDAYCRIYDIDLYHLDSDLLIALIDALLDLQEQYPEHVTVNL